MTAPQPYIGMQFANEDGDITVDGEIRIAFLAPVTGVSITLHDPAGADVPLSITVMGGSEGYVAVPLKSLAPATTYKLMIKGATDSSGKVMNDYTAPIRTAP